MIGNNTIDYQSMKLPATTIFDPGGTVRSMTVNSYSTQNTNLILTPARPSTSRTDLSDGSTRDSVLNNKRSWRDKIHNYLLDRIYSLSCNLDEFERLYSLPLASEEGEKRRDLEEDGLTRQGLEFFGTLRRISRRSEEEGQIKS